MSDCFHQLASRFAGESVFACLCARQLGFAVHARRPSMGLRSTSSQTRRFAVRVALPVRLWLTFRALRRGAASGAFSGRRTYRSESVRCRAFCARRGLSGTAFRRGFRLAARVGASSRALRPRAAIFPAACEWTKACWTMRLVHRRSAPRDAFGTEDFPCGAAGSLITLRPRTKNEKRLTMALQRTAPRVTVAAIPARCPLVRSWRCPTSVAAFFVPPSQLPRRAPQSLSLRR